MDDRPQSADQPASCACGDGTVFVAEKRGTVQRYDSVADPTPETVVDVSGATHDFWDRGRLKGVRVLGGD
jgi:hypothetical protein